MNYLVLSSNDVKSRNNLDGGHLSKSTGLLLGNSATNELGTVFFCSLMERNRIFHSEEWNEFWDFYPRKLKKKAEIKSYVLL